MIVAHLKLALRVAPHYRKQFLPSKLRFPVHACSAPKRYPSLCPVINKGIQFSWSRLRRREEWKTDTSLRDRTFWRQWPYNNIERSYLPSQVVVHKTATLFFFINLNNKESSIFYRINVRNYLEDFDTFTKDQYELNINTCFNFNVNFITDNRICDSKVPNSQIF